MAKETTKIKHPAFGTVREVTNPDSWREAGWEIVEAEKPAETEQEPFVTPVPLKTEKAKQDRHQA